MPTSFPKILAGLRMGGFPERFEAGFAWLLDFGDCGGHGVFARYDAKVIEFDRFRCHAGLAGMKGGKGVERKEGKSLNCTLEVVRCWTINPCCLDVSSGAVMSRL